VTHCIADHQGEPPAAEREGVVRVTTGGADRAGPVIAPGYREVREQGHRAPHEVAAAYRAWALGHPDLYEIAVRRPLRRDVIGATEQFAAEPLIEAFGGDPDRAMAFLGLAHGLVDLELSGHFPSGTDIDAIWRVAVQPRQVGDAGGGRTTAESGVAAVMVIAVQPLGVASGALGV
jgi:hypothetical protein